MKARYSTGRNHALTIFEILVIIVCLFVLAAVILLPILAAEKARASRLICVNNLKQINLALRVWEGDHNDNYPMSVSVTNGGAMESMANGDVAACFRIMSVELSNQLTTAKILHCPADIEHRYATNFTTDFNNSRISYFLSLDADEMYPQMITSGDDNLTVGGVPVKAGILFLSSGERIASTPGRHGHAANIGFADGSVAEESASALEVALVYSTNGTPFSTNRWAIP